jgi:precorrin-2 dehydrogenase/sirohydrochlorin ferrochelatase
VTVLSPTITETLAQEVEAGRVSWVEETFGSEHVQGAFLAIAATNDEEVNRTMVDAAAAAGALVCDASSAERSGIIFAAVHHAGEAIVAVFTDGRDPALARDTRDRIAALLEREGGAHGCD